MTPGEKMHAWQVLVREFENHLDALVMHPRWEAALRYMPTLQAVALQGREATELACGCYERYLSEGLAVEDEETLDLARFETQERAHEVRQLLEQLDGTIEARPVRQVN